MNKRTPIANKPYVQESKNEKVSGVKTTDPSGDPGSTPFLGGTRLEDSITIGKPASELYSYWRDFRHFPEFCSVLRSVSILDDQQSEWVAEGPGGKPLTWQATLIEDSPNELISWRSEKGDFENAGSVRFRQAPGDRGTEITCILTYNPPGGPLGSLIAKLSAKDPAVLLHQQLRRLKQLMETGEIATTDGQAAVLDA